MVEYIEELLLQYITGGLCTTFSTFEGNAFIDLALEEARFGAA